jgi:hypothetical protein
MDVKFRKYVDKTLNFYDDFSGTLVATFTVTGAFAWVHFNVFSVPALGDGSNIRELLDLFL